MKWNSAVRAKNTSQTPTRRCRDLTSCSYFSWISPLVPAILSLFAVRCTFKSPRNQFVIAFTSVFTLEEITERLGVCVMGILTMCDTASNALSNHHFTVGPITYQSASQRISWWKFERCVSALIVQDCKNLFSAVPFRIFVMAMEVGLSVRGIYTRNQGLTF